MKLTPLCLTAVMANPILVFNRPQKISCYSLFYKNCRNCWFSSLIWLIKLFVFLDDTRCWSNLLMETLILGSQTVSICAWMALVESFPSMTPRTVKHSCSTPSRTLLQKDKFSLLGYLLDIWNQSKTPSLMSWIFVSRWSLWLQRFESSRNNGFIHTASSVLVWKYNPHQVLQTTSFVLLTSLFLNKFNYQNPIFTIWF